MRARLAIASAGISVEHREILLRDKPAEMLAASPKGTVPVLLNSQDVIDESYDIMLWALGQNDPEGWLDCSTHDLIIQADGDFKSNLDRYKYASRSAAIDASDNRDKAAEFLTALDAMLAKHPFLYGPSATLPDMAIVTFVRQYAHVDLDWFEAQPWPNLIDWLNAFKASTRFKSIMQKYEPWASNDAAFFTNYQNSIQ